MPTTGLRGPYSLDNDTIDGIVTRTSAGLMLSVKSKIATFMFTV